MSIVTLAVGSQGHFPIFRKLAQQNYRVLNLYILNDVERMLRSLYSARARFRFSDWPFHPIAALQKQLHSQLCACFCALLSNKMADHKFRKHDLAEYNIEFLMKLTT